MGFMAQGVGVLLDDEARGEAECFILQQDPHTECHKSRKALLAHFK